MLIASVDLFVDNPFFHTKKVNVCILRPIVQGLVMDKKCQMKTKRFETEPNDQLSGHYG